MSELYYSRGRSDCPRRVFLAIPIGDGKPFANVVSSLVHTEMALHEAGWAMDLCIEANNCHVDDTRNSLVREFLKTDCDRFVFIDADVGYRDEDLVRLISHDRDVVAGVYPKKTDNIEFPVYLSKGEQIKDADGLLEVERVPTGFLSIGRAVLEVLAAQASKYRSNEAKPGDPPYPLIFERANDYEGGRRWSGDYRFCNKAKAAGYRIWVDPEMHFTHAGIKLYAGCLGDHLRSLGGLDHPRIVQAVERIRNEGIAAGSVSDLFVFANNHWAAPPEYLFAAYRMALAAKGPILECGSGLTTLVAGLAAEKTGNVVYTLEHDLEWLRLTRKRLERYGIKSVRLEYAPLEEHWPDFVWYRCSRAVEAQKYAAVICDGPPRKWGREGLFCLLEKQIENAHWLFDDTNDQAVCDLVTKYGKGRKLHALQSSDSNRPFGMAPCLSPQMELAL